MNKSGKSTTLLVLGFYLFYALLPLLYSTNSVDAEAQTGHACTYVQASERPILEQNLLLIPAQGNTEDPSGSAAHILLKKKRALAPSFKEIASKLFLLLAVFSDLDATVRATFISVPVPNETPNRPNGFQHYHSGASPPSV